MVTYELWPTLAHSFICPCLHLPSTVFCLAPMVRVPAEHSLHDPHTLG